MHYHSSVINSYPKQTIFCASDQNRLARTLRFPFSLLCLLWQTWPVLINNKRQKHHALFITVIMNHIDSNIANQQAFVRHFVVFSVCYWFFAAGAIGVQINQACIIRNVQMWCSNELFTFVQQIFLLESTSNVFSVVWLGREYNFVTLSKLCWQVDALFCCFDDRLIGGIFWAAKKCPRAISVDGGLFCRMQKARELLSLLSSSQKQKTVHAGVTDVGNESAEKCQYHPGTEPGLLKSAMTRPVCQQIKAELSSLCDALQSWYLIMYEIDIGAFGGYRAKAFPATNQRRGVCLVSSLVRRTTVCFASCLVIYTNVIAWRDFLFLSLPSICFAQFLLQIYLNLLGLIIHFFCKIFRQFSVKGWFI